MDWIKANCSSTNPIRTKISRLYDVVLFLDINNSAGYKVISKKAFGDLNIDKYDGYVYTKKISSDWMDGKSTRYNVSYDGPYIEYGVAPKQFVKYRVIKENNAYYIDRCIDTTDSLFDSVGLGDNPDYQVLYRYNATYSVYGIDFEDHLSNIINSRN